MATARDVTVPSQMEQSANVVGGRSQLVLSENEELHDCIREGPTVWRDPA